MLLSENMFLFFLGMHEMRMLLLVYRYLVEKRGRAMVG